MALFRRTPKGRHALGAAVTSIPSGPLAAPVLPVAPAPVAVPAAPSPAPVVTREPDIASSVAELLASGEAWAQDLEDFHAMHTPAAAEVSRPEAVALPQVTYEPPAALQATPVETAPVPVYQPPVESLPVEVPPAAYQPLVQAAPIPVPTPELSARNSLEAALSELLPGHAAPAAPPRPPTPRVQLGFRDGTSATLDPDSEQSLALQDLARTLSHGI